MSLRLFQLKTQVLQALSHERRLEIVELLAHGELSVGQIHSMLDLPQANISQHLSVLKDAQLVTARREGKQIFYSLTSAHLASLCDMLRDISMDVFGQDSELQHSAAISLNELLPLAHDPVCGMQLSTKTASFTKEYQGNTYYFCASRCAKIFTQDPTAYAQ